MEPAKQSLPAESVDVFVGHLNALTGEIETAMTAIAANDLDQLTESVGRQHTLATTVTILSKGIGQHSSSFPTDSRLRNAGEALHTVNLRYAALLKHSGRTINLLTSLCCSHAGELKEVRGTRPKRQTWSCEM